MRRSHSLPPTIDATLIASMSLIQNFTFDSLGAVRQEIGEWLGPEAVTPARAARRNAARDALISVLIHNLAEELSDARTCAQIQTLLAPLTRTEQRDHSR
jgi:hypothetical protein